MSEDETSNMTTKEIVLALLNRSVDKKSFYRRKIELIAADRLKTQERDIEWMSKKFDEAYKTWRESDSVFLEKIAALTDRAEKAERGRHLAETALAVYTDAVIDACDNSYQCGFMDGFKSRGEIDDENNH